MIEWFGVVYGEKVHEKVQRHLRYLLGVSAQIEEGGNGVAVQQRGKVRMEMRSRRGEDP